jgi:uncharacterized lipoprotein YmbA
MKPYSNWILPGLAVCALLVVLSACSGAGSSQTRYYVLGAVSKSAPASSAQGGAGPIVGVMPVELPEYLNQPGITTRGAANEVIRAEFDQWAGPLADEVTRIVGENLSRMLPSDRVMAGSGGRIPALDFAVEIEIAAFERDQRGAVQLIARWTVIRDADQSLVAMQTSRISRPVAGSGYNDIVTAMSGALANLSREIATAIVGHGRRP